MKKMYCDLCGEEIRNYEIPTTLDLNIGGKEFNIDLHSECYYKFIQRLRDDLLKEGRE